ncbi:MAG: acetate kinase [Candidatus Nanopelagicales bacterium]|nr:acetate kinase [Candidatus Nanopelagicales bacterium]
MTQVLVINAGSSSLKYAVVDSGSGARMVAGIVERIGEATSTISHEPACGAAGEQTQTPVPDHDAAFAEVRRRLDVVGVDHPGVVGHRVVHGGDSFTRPTLIDRDVIAAIQDCVPLAPLHNPAGLSGISAAMRTFPGVPQVAVFDTAFHTTIPADARTYAIDREVAGKHRLHRYGFHGTSHQYVSQRAAEFLQIPLGRMRAVTMHLGNGASACAVAGGRSVDTSMGVTPLEGLVMGTRSGDVDPSIPAILGREGWSADDIDSMLNHKSGLLGLCGANDMREVHRRAESGDKDADLARRVSAHRIRKYLGAYVFTLGHVDAIVFTAGIGEHDPWIRATVCAGLKAQGIELDPAANEGGSGIRDISTERAAVRVLVVPTDEEHAIAEQSAEVLAMS